jgi:hypothetical protein
MQLKERPIWRRKFHARFRPAPGQAGVFTTRSRSVNPGKKPSHLELHLRRRRRLKMDSGGIKCRCSGPFRYRPISLRSCLPLVTIRCHRNSVSAETSSAKERYKSNIISAILTRSRSARGRRSFTPRPRVADPTPSRALQSRICVLSSVSTLD